MKYLSICSGIEAATAAWEVVLGWTPLAFSEIEAFPRAVLQHHYPDVPLHGDFTKLRDEPWIGGADVLVGGTPCQAFSIAGLRKSLDDDRGNLTLEFVRLANAIDAARSVPSVIVWENVPGVLSVKDNAFGCFLAALVGDDAPLVPPRGKWSNAGLVAGPKRRAAWRVLDAQYFGLAQRRRRVFVVASARDDFDPAEVLFEREGVQRHTAPRRETGKTAPTTPSRSTAGGGFNDGGIVANSPRAEGFDASEDGTGRGTPLVPVPYSIMPMNSGRDYKARVTDVAQPIMAGRPTGGNQGGDYIIQPVAFDMRGREGGAQFEGPHETANIRAADGGSSRSYVLGSNNADAYETDAVEALLALREAIGAEAFAEWRSGISDSFQAAEVLQSDVHGSGVRREANEAGRGMDDGALSRPQDDPAGPVREMWEAGRARRPPQGRGLSKQHGRKLSEALPRLSSEGAQVGAFMRDLRRADEGARVLQSPLHSVQGRQTWAVRRLTPTECERLMGFPDGWTAISRNGKPAADGPRYKALGNSMAVPVMRWIGKRIQNS